ncbi:MAG: hypothetical protein ACRD8W_02265 [Nitrososphaeraceae archaeon]
MLHKLLELQKLIEVKIGSLLEEVEIGTNAKLSALYIANQRDEIQFLQWITRIIQSILCQDYYERQQLEVLQKRLEMMDMIEFENILQERIEELNFKLKNSNNLRESNFLINEIDVLESILGRLSDLKYGAETRAIEVANANNDFKRANHLRKQLIKIQNTKNEISAQCSNTKLRWTS